MSTIKVSDLNRGTTVIFINGYNKNSTTWNITEHGKNIGVETQVSKKVNTILLSLDPSDYIDTIPNLCTKIHNLVRDYIRKKVVLVTHSYGCFIAYGLNNLFPKIYNHMTLIDPTMKDNNYYEYLLSKSNDTIHKSKLDNWDSIPSSVNINTILRIHINVGESIEKIKYYDKMTNKNCASKLIVHYNVGHMIHYKRSGHIISDILDLC